MRPPWNHASSILAKRLIECLSPRLKCSLATLAFPGTGQDGLLEVRRILVPGEAGGRASNAVRLAMTVRQSSADVIHLIGTNALVFSPLCKLLSGEKRIVRHVFTSYDLGDQMIRPARLLINSFFIDAYAFTTPWVGDWSRDVKLKVRSFLLRPPINCDLYREGTRPKGEFLGSISHEYSILYMGPLLPSRFPAVSVLGALRKLIREGLDACLVVLTSAGRSSVQQVARLASLGRSLGLEKNLIVRRVDLTESERVEAYNSASVVIFPFVGPVPEKLADPPFGVLEAMACGGIVLGTRVLSIPEVVADGETGFLATKATASDIHEGLSRALRSEEGGEVGERARRKIVNLFSYPRVCEDAMKAYETLQ